MASRINEIKTSKVEIVRDALKAGSSVSNPVINFVNSIGTILWTAPLDATTPIQNIVNGKGYFKHPTESTWVGLEISPVVTGTVDHGELLDRDGDLCRTVTVGVLSGEIRLPSLNIDTSVILRITAEPYIQQD